MWTVTHWNYRSSQATFWHWFSLLHVQMLCQRSYNRYRKPNIIYNTFINCSVPAKCCIITHSVITHLVIYNPSKMNAYQKLHAVIKNNVWRYKIKFENFLVAKSPLQSSGSFWGTCYPYLPWTWKYQFPPKHC
jgi:hypothetical protein